MKNILFMIALSLSLFGCVCTSKKFSRKDFSKEEERAVFEKAKKTDNPDVRLDICGSQIRFSKYGKKNRLRMGDRSYPAYRRRRLKQIQKPSASSMEKQSQKRG